MDLLFECQNCDLNFKYKQDLKKHQSKYCEFFDDISLNISTSDDISKKKINTSHLDVESSHSLPTICEPFSQNLNKSEVNIKYFINKERIKKKSNDDTITFANNNNLDNTLINININEESYIVSNKLNDTMFTSHKKQDSLNRTMTQISNENFNNKKFSIKNKNISELLNDYYLDGISFILDTRENNFFKEYDDYFIN